MGMATVKFHNKNVITAIRTSILACMRLLCFSLLVIPISWSQDQTYNPNYFYFINGSALGGWGLTLGDKGNWVMPVQADVADSADKQITLMRADYQQSGDALHLKWSRSKGKGQFAMYGAPIDISKLENTAALTMEVKVIKKPKSTVSIAMDCGYPCRGEMNIQKMFRGLDIGKWTTFPIPLNCFSTRGADLSKINSPIIIASDDQFELQIANIRLELLPEGTPTCAN
jgi:hypothetical protein